MSDLTRDNVVAQLRRRLGTIGNATHLQTPVAWLRLLVALPGTAAESSGGELLAPPNDATVDAESPALTRPRITKRQRKVSGQ